MTEAEDAQTQEDDAPQAITPDPTPAAPVKRRVRRHGLRILWLVLVSPIVFVLIAGLSLLGREITAPSWIKHLVEDRAALILNGGSLEFDHITVTLGTDLHPRVLLAGAELQDQDGAILAKVPRVEGLISPRGLIKGDVLAQEIHLSGAEIALRRAQDGQVALSFNLSGPSVSEASSFTELMDLVEQTLESEDFEALAQVRADGLIINYDDARAGRSWIVDGGQIDLDLRRQKTQFSAQLALLSGRSYPTELRLDYESPRNARAATFGVTITDAVAGDLASQSPALSWMSVLEAPLSANMRGSIDSTGALGPLSAVLQLDEGALQPTEQTRPIRFDHASLHMNYLPRGSEIRFEQVNLSSDWGQLTGSGKAYLRDVTDGWPNALLGQFNLSEIEVNPNALFETPLKFSDASVEFRLHPSPFLIELGQVQLRDDQSRIQADGTVMATPDGWAVALDMGIDQIAVARLMQFWPESIKPRTRTWFENNIITGDLSGVTSSFRTRAQSDTDLFVGFEFDQANVRFLRDMPPITEGAGIAQIERNNFTLSLERGRVNAPEGGQLDLAGSVFHIPDITVSAPPATVALRIQSTITAAMSILDQPPLELLTKAGMDVAIADGRARISGALMVPLKPRVENGDVIFNMAAELRDVRSDRLVENRVLTASNLALRADNDGIAIEGPMIFGQVPVDGRWSQSFEPGNNRTSRIEATAELSERFLDEFNIDLPPGSVSGRGIAQIQVELPKDQAPSFALRSDLRGIGLQLASLGWSKSTGQTGELVVSGQLGPVPRVDALRLAAAGLSTNGRVVLNSNGTLNRAEFDRVQLGNWLDVGAVLRSRGAGVAPLIEVTGNGIDLRGASFGGGSGDGGPMSLSLGRLQVTQGIALTDFSGDFSALGGFSGEFTAMINGIAPVRGTVVPESGRSAIRIVSDRAGEVVAAAGLLENGRGGNFDLTLTPRGADGHYAGNLEIRQIRVKNAPALAGLLDAISVVGLLQQLDGQGLAFSDVDSEFFISPQQVVVTKFSAIGASMGISLDGTYDLRTKVVDFQGVVSPFYLLNGIGSILTRPGEGLIGFNFTLRGPEGQTRVAVNPLSALTPGMFREIFRRPPPQVQPPEVQQ
ncbi:DUF3971 domain-containing protein [Aestuariibius sp. HNIBRBA575]|uniref:YhdP family protein n=1 Tax=Aestuariibius sp. HNIBRBA575 TaxID=3233343 RepID=UPI0034A515E5